MAVPISHDLVSRLMYSTSVVKMYRDSLKTLRCLVVVEILIGVACSYQRFFRDAIDNQKTSLRTISYVEYKEDLVKLQSMREDVEEFHCMLDSVLDLAELLLEEQGLNLGAAESSDIRQNDTDQNTANRQRKDWHVTKKHAQIYMSNTRRAIDSLISKVRLGLEFEEKLEASEQSRSIRRLSIVAALFLPLNLAASMLGMQSRAKDLSMIWFDFCGLCLIVGLACFVFLDLRLIWEALVAGARQLIGRRMMSWLVAINPSLERPRIRLPCAAVLTLLATCALFIGGMTGNNAVIYSILKYGVAPSLALLAIAAADPIVSWTSFYFKLRLVEKARGPCVPPRRDTKKGTEAGGDAQTNNGQFPPLA